MTDKTFFFYVADISGSPVLGETDFSVFLDTSSGEITGYSSSVTESNSGYYKVVISGLEAPESGIVELNYDGPEVYIVSPDWAEFSIDSDFTVDDVYGAVQASTASIVNITRNNKFGNATIQCKENSDLTHTIRLNQDLTGWTSLSVKAYPDAILVTPTTPALTGTYSVSIDDIATGTITALIGRDVLNNVVPAGVSQTKVYSDIDGIDPDGLHRTIIELTLNVKRDFNRP